MKPIEIDGLPTSIANDAWWLSCSTSDSDADADAAQPHPDQGRHRQQISRLPFGGLFLIALVLLADMLFWQHDIGLSLILFSAALTGAALNSLRPDLSRRQWTTLAAFWSAFALPVAEYVQALSLAFLVVGHMGLLIWCATRTMVWGHLLRSLARMPYVMPAFSVMQGVGWLQSSNPNGAKVVRETVSLWLLPLGLGFVFLVLIAGANPLVEQWLDQIAQVKVTGDIASRALFWGVAGFAVFPFLMFRHLSHSGQAPDPAAANSRGMVAGQEPRRHGIFVNLRSVTNSLLLFNAMFLVQNLSDIAFLWGGATLPEGMSYAAYAHRGAYPLMATSVLAGLFALISRQYTDRSGLLKLLLLVWVLQNVFLVFSALARLDLYVDVYGMTYLRVRAGIGMALVLAGMLLLLWQVWRGRTNSWMVSVFGAVLAATLYVSCFVNFAYVIARVNLTPAHQIRDAYYLCQNTPDGVKAMLQYARSTGETVCADRAADWSFAATDARDWSFRRARLAASKRDFLETVAGSSALRPRDTPAPGDYQRYRGEY